jgi:hypothetical protein
MQAHTPTYSGHVPSQRPYYALRRSARRCVSSLAPILTSSQIDGPPLGPSPPRGFCCLPVSQPPAQVAPLPCPACAVQPDLRSRQRQSLVLVETQALSALHTVDTAITLCVCVRPRTRSFSGAPLHTQSWEDGVTSASICPNWYGQPASQPAPFKPRPPANKSYRSWAPSNTRTDHGATTTTPWPWSRSLPERFPRPYALCLTTWTPPCALPALASCATTNLRTNTTKVARRNWTMLRSEEEEEAPLRRRHLRLGCPIQYLPHSPSRHRMRRDPTAQTATPPCRMGLQTRKCHTASRTSRHQWTCIRKYRRAASKFRCSARVPSLAPTSSWQVCQSKHQMDRNLGRNHNTRARNRHLKDSGHILHHKSHLNLDLFDDPNQHQGLILWKPQLHH